MFATNVLNSVDEVPAADWERLTRRSDIDSSRGFLRFREYLEPGRDLLLTASAEGELAAALRAVIAVPGSGFTSDPWKFLGSTAVLRAEPGQDEAELKALHETHAGLIRGGDGEDGPLWQTLTRRFGPCFVVREFDRSELWYAPELDPAARARATETLIAAAQRVAIAQGAGTVAFPYVPVSDPLLREALTAAGFQHGTLTGACTIDTRGCADYADFLSRLPSRRRRMFRLEEQRLADAPDLDQGAVDLGANADRIAQLEVNTLLKYGGVADRDAIYEARIKLAEELPEAVRIAAVRRGGELIASAMHLVGRQSVVAMTYGADYGIEDRSSAYSWAIVYFPVRLAVEAKLDGVRMGFEGFRAKTVRGALVEPREMWLWTPDPAGRAELGELLGLVGARNDAYLSQYPQVARESQAAQVSQASRSTGAQR
ncbi:MAG TPA: peptidogalycan biosysnthesis protein [Actinocrinis sp.]|nr:peptidogalycan biosysnthesis protein [Actinocrinis sp.]